MKNHAGFVCIMFLVWMIAVPTVRAADGQSMEKGRETVHSSSQEEEMGELDKLGEKVGPAIAQTIRNMFISLGLFSISSLLIVFFAKKAWQLNIRVWLAASAAIVVVIIGCARFMLEDNLIHTHLNPFILISCLLLWFLALAVFGYGWRRGLLLSLLVSFSYSFWIGVYECFL